MNVPKTLLLLLCAAALAIGMHRASAGASPLGHTARNNGSQVDTSAAAPAVAPAVAATPTPAPPTPAASLADCAARYAALQQPPAAPGPDTVDPVVYAPYNDRMQQFLNLRCYVVLESDPANRAAVQAGQPGWLKDKTIRDTGPFIDGQEMGTHPAVFIYYDPLIAGWLINGRNGSPPDGAIVVKVMFAPPAAQYAGMTPDQVAGSNFMGWSVIVRDAAASKDGWYWGGFDENPAPPVDAYPFQQYPYAGFGQVNGCVRCHASAAGEAFTFSALRNIEANSRIPETLKDPLIFYNDNSWRNPTATPTPAPTSPAPAQPTPTPAPAHAVNDLFLQTFPEMDKVSIAQVTPFPPVIYDTVTAGPKPDHQFLPSNQCAPCHGGLSGKPFGPNMFVPPSGALDAVIRDQAHLPGSSHSMIVPVQGSGVNLSPPGEWQWSMMGLAGRDPVFFAQLESEGNLHPQDNVPAMTQDRCLRCHGVMGQRQFHLDNPDPKALFTSDHVFAITEYGALARDGISCAVCHQVTDPAAAKPPAPLSATDVGRFTVNPPQNGQLAIYGPYADPRTLSMRTALGMTPQYSPFIKQAGLCASCHTIRLPALDAQNRQLVNPDGSPYLIFEQTTYLEWLNSTYAQAGGQTCQNCHMPTTFPVAPTVPGVAAPAAAATPLAFEIAGIQSQRYPAVENLAPLSEVTVNPRPGFARHSLHGDNLFALEMFNQFDRILGVAKQDYMTGSSAGLDFAALNYVEQAQQRTAQVTLSDVPTLTVNAAGEPVLRTAVTVKNLTGHRFPSGVGFRRAFLELAVTGGPNSAAAGEVLWASGATNGVGAIIGGDGQILPSEFFTPDAQGRESYQPHYQVITNTDQVQIYEELTVTPEGKITSSFISRCSNLKDNRLLPNGWSKNPPGFDAYSAQTGSGFLNFTDAPKVANDHCKQETALEATFPEGTRGDPDYDHGGGDTVIYEIPLAQIGEINGAQGSPAEVAAQVRQWIEGGEVRARLLYQALPPHYLAERFADGQNQEDAGAVSGETAAAERLYYLASNLDLSKTAANHWKLEIGNAWGAIP